MFCPNWSQDSLQNHGNSGEGFGRKTDVAIIAVGASSIIPKIPGVENGSKISISGLRDWIWAKKF